jgi:hypothetical protein
LIWHRICAVLDVKPLFAVMGRIIFFTALISAVFFSGCSTSVRIFSDADPTASFEQYHTYNFLDFTEGNRKTITDTELERIRVAFAREIEAKGMHFEEKDADVSVQIIVYHRLAGGGYYYPPYRYNYMERAIAVDMYDNHSQKHVWHGAAVGELEYDPEKRTEELPAIVARIFQEYPIQPGNPD